MASALSARDLVSLVRRKVKDASSEIWSDADILAYADEALEDLFTTARLAGGEHLLETSTWAPSDFTETETDVWEIRVPEHVAAVRRIEVQGTDSQGTFSEVPQVELEERGTSRGPFSSHSPTWYRAGGDRTIHIVGTLQSFPTIRYWYYRQWAPLHFGTTTNYDFSTLTLDTNPTGKVVRRDDVYNGMYITVEDGSQDLRRIIDFDGTDVTVDADWSFTPGPSQGPYSLISPLPPEHNSLLVNQTALIFLEDSGQSNERILKNPRYQHLYQRFKAGMAKRDHARPRRLYSRRTGYR